MAIFRPFAPMIWPDGRLRGRLCVLDSIRGRDYPLFYAMGGFDSEPN